MADEIKTMKNIKFNLQSEIHKNVPLAVVTFQEGEDLRWARSARSFPAAVLKTAREDGFRGNKGDCSILRVPGQIPAERLILSSAGKVDEADLHQLRTLAAVVAKRVSQAKLKSFSFLLPDESGTCPEQIQAVTEGILLGLYQFKRYKSQESSEDSLSEVFIVVPQKESAECRQALQYGQSFAEAVRFTRDLVNEPPSRKVPETIGRTAQSLSGKHVKVRVFHKKQLAQMKMNALLGVNRGSAHPPVLVHMHYKPACACQKRLALIGKGVTFDSGGLSLKPSASMMTMKYDMAGAATVLGIFKALSVLRPPVEVHGIAPLTENMPGPDAYKPGDVVKASNGKTIEVLNTDAEGRVLLADALSYASKLSVDEIIDVATLTGAAVVALGKSYCALMSDQEDMVQMVMRSSEKAGEKVWRLPLEPAYRDHIKSHVADIKNIGNSGEAGTIIGGLFLKEFVGDKRWAHLDMAAMGWGDTASELSVPGATGAMVRTLLHYIVG